MVMKQRNVVVWMALFFAFSLFSLTEFNLMTSVASDPDPDFAVFQSHRESVDLQHSSPLQISNNRIAMDHSHSIDGMMGLNSIRRQLEHDISLLTPQISGSDALSFPDPLPLNSKCTHSGKVFAIGIMKTGTTSMNAALQSLGYECYGDSCIHVGNWDVIKDQIHLWQPVEVINLSLLRIKTLWMRYLRDSYYGLNFGDSPWCFLYPVMDHLYPNSKFILSKRKDDKTYINSYLKYLRKNKKNYALKGLTDGEFSALAVRRYHLHNEMVEEYFKDRPDDLLIVTVDEENPQIPMMQKLNRFLGCNETEKSFPRRNRAGARGKPINVEPEWLDWRRRFDVNESDEFNVIPYVKGQMNGDLSVHLTTKQEFVLDLKTFLVNELHGDIDSLF